MSREQARWKETQLQRPRAERCSEGRRDCDEVGGKQGLFGEGRVRFGFYP